MINKGYCLSFLNRLRKKGRGGRSTRRRIVIVGGSKFLRRSSFHSLTSEEIVMTHGEGWVSTCSSTLRPNGTRPSGHSILLLRVFNVLRSNNGCLSVLSRCLRFLSNTRPEGSQSFVVWNSKYGVLITLCLRVSQLPVG